MYGHRRDRSSLSTNCSHSSGHSRVLPFATAPTLRKPSLCAPRMEAIAETPSAPKMYISSNRRFAVAQPRRVITQPGCTKPQSASIRINTLLGAGDRTFRARPIIGLGVTLNPADTLVRLRPKRSDARLTSPVVETCRSSVLLSEAFSRSSPALDSLASLSDVGSPRYRDPQMVPTAAARSLATASMSEHQKKQQLAALSWLSSSSDKSSFSSAASEAQVPDSSYSMLTRSICTNDRRKPVLLSCLLCFGLVKVSLGHTHSMSCPGCGTLLDISKQSPLDCV
ncbi:hypothetical protein EV183_004383 [Coemansia sp. RSA 2336]|nr:hypothetical protein EV183_004383 [Coemansia sp. RSA 2336]